jgi:hypothetical protein
MHTPQKPHLDAVKRILRYIKHMLQCGFFYEAKSQLQVHGYMDVDWAGNVSDIRSSSGFIFFVKVVLLIGTIKNNQQLQYQTWRQNTEVQQLLHVK